MSSRFPQMLHEIFEIQAEKTPTNVAVEFYPETKLTYGQLNETSNRLARYIKAHQLPNKTIIALSLQKSHLSIVAVMASLKAGLTWLPLPLDAPASRIQQILGACDIALVLRSRSALDTTAIISPCYDIDEILESPDFDSISDENLTIVNQCPEDLCHVLFTSGSTGIPKGVMLDHRAVANCVRALVKVFELNERTRTLQFAAMTFDIFGLDLFMTLASGGCLVVASLSDMIEDMTDFVHKQRITFAQLTPSVIQLMDPSGVPVLAIIASSGEALPSDLADRWRHSLRLFNCYGPTETIACTIQELNSNQAGSTCIGEALAGLEVSILAEQSVDEVAQGEVGEICVAGPQLFRGYISVQKDIKSTEYERNGRRFYRTGDLGRWEMTANGTKTFTCLGRRDNQVKVHGVRVDLGDVENSILASPMVLQCAALLPNSGHFSGHICAILIPQRLSQLSDKSLNVSQNPSGRETSDVLSIRLVHSSPHLSAALTDAKNAAVSKLPKQCIPSYWCVILQMPLTQSGKIDRVKLRNWVENLDLSTYTEHAKSLSSRSPSSNPQDHSFRIQQLQSILADILGRTASSISTNATFFELGADSLDIIRFVSETRKAGFGYNLAQMYAARTISELNRLQPDEKKIPQDGQEFGYRPFSLLPQNRPLAPILEKVAATCNLSVGEIEDVYPCTPYQSGLMALDLKCPMSYVCLFSWTLPKHLSMDWFRSSWNSVISSEPVLRNRLVWDELAQNFWQVTVSHVKLEWSKEIFAGPMSLGHSLCRGFVTQDAHHDSFIFQLKIHHSIIDGWSLRLMLNRLKSIYYREEPVCTIAVPYTQFIKFRMAEDGRRRLSSQSFWTQYLTDYTASDFPAALPNTGKEVHATRHKSLSVPIILKEIASRYQVTPATILYASAVLALGMHGDTEDVGFGMILSGRDAPLHGIYDMIGPAFAIVPFRSQIDRQKSIKHFLQNVAQQIISIIPHQHYGLQEIKHCSASATAACEFRCLVVVQPEDENLAGDGLWEEVRGQTSGLADNIPLSLEYVLGDAQIQLKSNFDPAVLSEDDCGILLRQIREVLLGFMRIRPEDFVEKINFTTHEEQSRIVEWASRFGQPVNRCLHELVQSSLEQYSGLIAISDQSTQREYTYKELNHQTNRLAKLLHSTHGICPGAIVVLALEKSALAVIAILAILRAGGAYVPVEPNWPLERIRHILNETEASLILCSTLTVNSFEDSRTNVLVLSEGLWTNEESRLPKFDKAPQILPDNLAIVMYTSGSTGVPKGVMLEHRALSTSLTHLACEFALKPGIRHLQFSSFVYDVSISDIFIPLLSGACICIPDEDSRINRLSLVMKELKIESAILTPSILDLIVPEDATSLRVVMTGGEMTRKSLIEKWANRIRLINAYGPTEASITTTVTDDLNEISEPSNIGRNVTSWHWIVRRDSGGKIYSVPTGCIGEIAIAGHVLARGYLHNAELTSLNFVEAPDLVVGQMTSRIYLTGDLGRYNAVGQVCIVGRRDRMTKVNGVRVEPGESEYQLRLLGGIFTSCVVQCLHDVHHVARLAAFVEVGLRSDEEIVDQGVIVAKSTSTFKTSSRDAYLRLQQILPIQYVPTLFVPITRIPYLASSKVDLRRLRDELLRTPDSTFLSSLPDDGDPLDDQEMCQNPAELAVEAAFRHIFSIKPRLHNSTNFFQLGGDSFAAIKVVSYVRKLGFEVSVSNVFNYPKIRDLATMASQLDSMDSMATKPKRRSSALSRVPESLIDEICNSYKIAAGNIDDIYPTSPFQEGLAALTPVLNGQVAPQQPSTYEASIAFRLSPTVLVEPLINAIEKVILWNPIYRTRICHSSQGTMQVVLKASENSREPENGNARMFVYEVKHDTDTEEWRLFLNIHHALYDAPTMERLRDDVNLYYKQPDGTSPAPKPYRHFIEYLSTFDQEAARKYWTDQLTDAPLLAFPQQPTNQKVVSTESLEQELCLNLEKTKTAGISTATILAASVALLLAAYCNTNDVCFGMTLSGREATELEDIAGPTMSTVPMRVKFDLADTMELLLRRLQSSLLQMRQHQHYGLPNIAGLPNEGARNASRFRTLFVMQQAGKTIWRMEDETLAIQDCVREDTSMFVNYALVIIAFTDNETGKTTLRIEYDPNCLQKVEANRVGEQLQQLAAQCTDLGLPIGEVQAISAADRSQISAWNQPIPTHPEVYLHQIFEHLAGKNPDSLALESTFGAHELRRLSYRQLNQQAERLSAVIEHAAPDAQFIGINLKKSPLIVIAMLATWKTGRTIVMLDPAAPAKRLKGIIEEVDRKVLVLTESSHLSLFDSTQVVVLDPLNPNMTTESTANPPQRSILNGKKTPSPSDAAYIIYTSGSSGSPKGVVVSYAACAVSLADAAAVMGLNNQTRMLQFAASTFDTSLLETFGTLVTGGCLCIPSEAERFPATVTDVIVRFRITHLILTPTVAQFVELDRASDLQVLLLVGEPPSRDNIQKWTKIKPKLRLMNGYGPTEASVHSSTNVYLHEGDVNNIGHGTACNLFLTMPDDLTRLAPIGATGEIIICGNTVATGYLQKPEMTYQVFGVNLPWMSRPHGTDIRYYRTGDLARYASNGSMIYLGRKDLQAKIHGQRVELAEIDWQIDRSKIFLGSIVEIVGQDLLVAFVIVETLQDGNYEGALPVEYLPYSKVEAARKFLGLELPAYMIPSVYVPVNRLPLTSSGKVDRRALRKSVESSIDAYRCNQRDQKRRPRTAIQSLVAQVWAEELAISKDQVGLDDTILILGGDSISFIRIVANARRRNLNFSIKKIFHNSSLEEVADTLEGNLSKSIALDVPATVSVIDSPDRENQIDMVAEQCQVPSESIVDIYPCTSMQESLMIASEKSRGAYNNQELFKVTKNRSVSKLSNCLRAIWRRHDILRTRIVRDEVYHSVQVVIDEGLEISQVEGDLEVYLRQDAATSFEYGQKLSRCAIVLSSNDTFLVISQHHAVFDGWSQSLLIQEIQSEYSQQIKVAECPLRFSSFVRHVVEINESLEARSHWKDYLAGYASKFMPQIKHSVSFEANKRYTMETLMPSTRHHTLATLAEGAWAIVISRYSESEDLAFGTIRSGRTAPIDGLESLVGPTLVTIPRRLRPSKDQLVSGYLQKVNATVMEAVPWEQYSHQSLRKLNDGARQACHYSSIIVIHMPPSNDSEVKDAILSRYESPLKDVIQANCFTISCRPQSNGKLYISATYDDRVIHPDAARWATYHLSRVLVGLSNNRDMKIEDVNMAGSEDTKQVQQWNGHPIETCWERVDKMFSERATKSSNLPAINASDGILKYDQLEKLSNKAAAMFSSLGVQKGDVVPLVMEKSAAMVCVILGILKSGAAYAPLATDLPRERMQLLLSELKAKHVICSPAYEEDLKSSPVQVISFDLAKLRATRNESDALTTKMMNHDAVKGELSIDPDAQSMLQSGNPELAYVLFTSGSTGIPKAVMVEHRALATTIRENGRELNFIVGTRTLSFAAYTFDVNVMELFLTLIHGGCLYFPTADVRLSGLTEYINENEIEMALMTPTAVRNLLSGPEKVPSLRVLRVGGESCPQHLVAQWSNHVRFINSYGPTETCVDACRNADMRPDSDSNNIGYPIGTHLWIVQPETSHRLSPVGCSGELMISGPTLALGYMNDQEKTERVFLDGHNFPWLPDDEGRLYATGDIVRQNFDGSIKLIGRKDRQTKLNGIRIEMGEVETTLELCRDIAAAIVEKFEVREGESEALVAFLTLATVDSSHVDGILLPPTEEVRRVVQTACAKAAELLPPSIIPQMYVPLTTMPLTANGKTDRSSLRLLFESCTQDQLASYRISSTLQPTKTVMQKIFQGLWAQILSLNPKQIAPTSTFIAIGGDSLAAIQLSAMCREVKLPLSVADILQRPRLEDLAEHAEQRQKKLGTSEILSNSATQSLENMSMDYGWTKAERNQVAEACEIEESDIEDVYPCTPTQVAIIAATIRRSDSYVSRQMFAIPTVADLERLRMAWEKVFESTPVSRTRICSITGSRGFSLVQVVCKYRCFGIPVLSDFDADHAEIKLGSPLMQIRVIYNQRGRFLEMTRHHAIYDAPSTALMWDDLRCAYEHSVHPPLRPPYRKYVDYLNSLDEGRTIKFWDTELHRYQGENYPARPSQDYIPKASSGDQRSRRETFQWQESCLYTFATVVRAAWAVILSTRGRVTDSSRDICFLATLSGRSAALDGVEDIIGPTLNTVPVRTRFDMEQSIDQYLSQVQEGALSMLPHEHLGLSRIREIHQSASNACQSSSLLVVQQVRVSIDTLPANLTRVDIGSSFSEPFGIILECSQDSSQNILNISATYDPNLLTQNEIDHLLEQTIVLIVCFNRGCSSQMTIHSAIWSLAQETDYQRMAVWNSLSSSPSTGCLDELVEYSLRKCPHNIAIDAHDGQCTYQQLDEAANALASQLQDTHGVKPGEIIPLCFEKSIFMIIAILAVLKSGAGYAPLDVGGPMIRLEHIIRETDAKLVLMSQMQATKYQFSAACVIVDQKILEMTPPKLRYSGPSIHDIAYVTFTSGSTGVPKGVVTEHGAAYLSIQEHGKRYQHSRRGSSLRTLQFSSYTFDASVLDIFATLAFGGCLCIPSEDERMASLEEVVTRMHINFADLTPTVANLVDPAKMPTLRGLAIGGEMANKALIVKWTSDESPLDVFVNSYGPTEASIGCAAGIIDPKMPIGNVGKAVAASLWIVDETDFHKLVPISSVGELAISGPTLARGYLNDEKRTAETFIEGIPWLSRFGHKRLYKTGDLARFDLDGNVEILGRKEDGQIKLRGLRIELGEVEAALAACKTLPPSDRIVVARVILHGEPTLAAFIQLLDDCSPVASSNSTSIFHEPSEQQQNFAQMADENLRTCLLEYMIPQLWVLVRDWPLTVSKKTDRRCLVAQCEALSAATVHEYQKSYNSSSPHHDLVPMTEIQGAIKDAWIKILRKAKDITIGMNDDFFKLGGSSLDVIKLIAELRSRNIKISAQEIFMSRSLHKMAEVIDSKTLANPEIQTQTTSNMYVNEQHEGQGSIRNCSNTSSPSQSQIVGENSISQKPSTESATSLSSRTKSASVRYDNIKEPFDAQRMTEQPNVQDIMLATQTQLEFLIEGQKWCRAYYAWWFIQIDTSCPISRVHTACKALVLRHEILRTRFHLVKRQCYQVILRDALDFKVIFHDGYSHQMGERLDNDTAQHMCFGNVLTRFRLLIEEGTGRQTLAMGLSHAQYDGFCISIILKDLCSGLTDGKILAAPSDHKYCKFIEHTKEASDENAKAFWRELLMGASPTKFLPRASTAQPVMDRNIMRRILLESRSERQFSHNVICKASWAIVLSQLSCANDVVFANIVSGRFAAFEGASDVVGPCLNVVPVRTRIEGDKRICDILKQVHEQQVAMIPYEATSFNTILEQAEWPVSTRCESIFQYQHLPEDQLEQGDPNAPKLVGNAVYGGGLLQHNGCWLMAWPVENGETVFRFTFCEDTISLARAEVILDLLSKILRAIDNNVNDTVGNLLSPDTASRLESMKMTQPVHTPDHIDRQSGTIDESRRITEDIPTLNPLQSTIHCLKSIWSQVLLTLHDRPLGPSSHSTTVSDLFPNKDSLPTTTVDNLLDDMNYDELVNASFFSHFGGDSIAAAEAASLCQKTGLNLSMQDFMDFPTLALQADLLAGKIERPKREMDKVKLILKGDYRYN